MSEARAICPECDKDEFHVLIPDMEELVEFECLECGFIIKPDSPGKRLKKFITRKTFKEIHCIGPL